jgi:hypothetical protein
MRADQEQLALYLRHVQADGVRSVHDKHTEDLSHRWSELEWQTLWYAGACGETFRATNGSLVEVLQFGRWNHEAGPDFVDAVIRVDGKQEPLCGDIELDLSASDWERHGHATNERFNRVVLHVFLTRPGLTFFTRTADHREVLQVHLQRELPIERLTSPVARVKAGACSGPMQGLAPEEANSVLETAAQVRLDQKVQLLQRAIKVHGFEQALFQHVAMALGYKENKLPFLLLTQRAPLSMLRAQVETAEAVLFGLSGFLEKASLPDSAAETASAYLKSLWSAWWPRRGELHHLVLPPDRWHLSSTRPSNHPQRRLAALASLVRRWPELQSLPPDLKRIRRFFAGLSHPFWNYHYTLASAPSPRPVRLIGSARINDLLANVFIPLLWVSGHLDWNAVRQLPAELDNARLRAMRQRLFGNTAAAARAPRYLYQQQGLLQLADDFCAANQHDCSRCRLPGYLAAREKMPRMPQTEKCRK